MHACAIDTHTDTFLASHEPQVILYDFHLLMLQAKHWITAQCEIDAFLLGEIWVCKELCLVIDAVLGSEDELRGCFRGV